jgi:putative peptide zinc metalloprotease protein
LDELSPFLRLDGYYIVSDLTGVPNLFSYIKPITVSLIPGREADESVKALKPWVRTVLTVWVLSVVPFLVLGFAVLVFFGPWFIATVWDSFFVQYGELSRAFDDGRTIDGVLALVDVMVLVTPVIGGTLIFAWVSKRLIVAGWSRSRGRPLLRTGFTMVPVAVVAVVALMFLVWWPQLGPLGPVQQVERGDIPKRDIPTHERQKDHHPTGSGPVNSAAGVPAPTPTAPATATASATATAPATASATASAPATATASATASAAATATAAAGSATASASATAAPTGTQ